MPLRSQLFQGDPQLEACLVQDSAHIMLGAVGNFVSKIQQALSMVDGSSVDPAESATGLYGPSTAAAVLAYKRKRNIINRSYQTQADNIVGKMTIASLDNEMAELERKQPPGLQGSMIEASVGLGGVNIYNDVLIIQNALTVWRARQGRPWISRDGRVGPDTLQTIRQFQEEYGLPTDGRVDPNGLTLQRLKSLLGEEAEVFAPTISELLPILDSLSELATVAPPRAQELFYREISQLGVLRVYMDLIRGLRSQPFLTSEAPRPQEIGFAGADDAVLLAGLLLLTIFVAAVIVIMTQSPVFKKAVEVRAKELDRILHDLKLHNVAIFEAALKLIIDITNEQIDRANQCKKSPTFTPSPECNDAISNFRAIVQRIRNMVNDIAVLIAQVRQAKGSSGIFGLKVRLNRLLNLAQQLVWDLQAAVAEMAEKCKCPEILL